MSGEGVIMSNFLQDFLLLKSTNIDVVLNIVRNISTPLLTVTFTLGALFENYTTQNFVGLFKRLFVAVFLISYGPLLLKNSVNLSFDMSARVLTAAQKNSPVVQLIERAKKLSQQSRASTPQNGFIEKSKSALNGLWESTAFVTKLMFDDGLSAVIFVISYTALLILGQFYTIVYNFTYVSIPLVATLLVFQPTYSVSSSLSRSFAWIFLMPIFTMITILLLSMSFVFPQDGNNNYYFTTLENLINFCIMAMMLLFVPTIVSGYLSGAGILSTAENFSKTAAFAVASGTTGFVLNNAKNFGGKVLHGRDYGLMTLGKVGVNKGLDRLGEKSIEARQRLSSSQMTQNSFLRSSQLNTQSSEKSENNQKLNSSTQQNNKLSSSFFTKAIDRSIVATDNVFNFKKNQVANKAVKTDSLQRHAQMDPRQRSELFGQYKQSAHRSSQISRPIDHKVSQIRSSNMKTMKPTHQNLGYGSIVKRINKSNGDRV
jgi:hypothetical protein